MVRIRMKRMGRTHRPFFRINAVDQRSPRDGRIIEELGWYDPMQPDVTKAISLKEDRIKHWISVGAQPSQTVGDMLAKRGLINAEKWVADRERRVKRKIEAMAKAKADAAAAAAGAETKAE